jgi:putative transposase
MKSKLVAQLLTDLGVIKWHSRPHTSDDNPFSEAQFKTLKYRPDFPTRFPNISAAEGHCQNFFSWYNLEHKHSGIAMLTPQAVHYHLTDESLAQRQCVLNDAFARHPERFKYIAPTVTPLPTSVWINAPIQTHDAMNDSSK